MSLLKVQPGCLIYLKFYSLPYSTVGLLIPFDNLLPFILVVLKINQVRSASRMRQAAETHLISFPTVMSFENNVFSEILCFLQWHQETGRWS